MPADGGVGARIDRETSGRCCGARRSAASGVTPASTVASRSSGLTRRIALHLAQVERDAALEGVDVPLERRAGAERNHRQPKALADRQDRRDFVGGLGKHDEIRAPPARGTTRRGCDARGPPPRRSPGIREGHGAPRPLPRRRGCARWWTSTAFYRALRRRARTDLYRLAIACNAASSFGF